MNKNDDPNRSSFDPSAIDDLFEEVVDGLAAATRPAPEPEPVAPGPQPTQTAPEPVVESAPAPQESEPAPNARAPIELTLESEEALDAALAESQAAPNEGADDEAADDETGDSEPGDAEPAEPVEPISPEEAREVIERLAAAEARFRGGESSKEEVREDLAVAGDALDRLPKDPTFDVLKDELLDAYFSLDRAMRPTQEVPVKPEYEPRKRRPTAAEKASKNRRKRPTVTRDVSMVERPSNRKRVIAMVVIAVLLGGGRIAYYFNFEQAETKTDPEITRAGVAGVEGSRVSLNRGGKRTNDFNQGIPVMTYLRVVRLADGGFQAKGVAIDLDSKTLKFNYKWYKNGKLITVESEGLLGADKVEPLATYTVEATAGDGKLTSAPMTSAPMVIKPKPKSGK